ncbi:hypothetical protein RCH18_002693 [Flavobacterium sp. PL11]|uniref:DUF6913 domain-containing protein n=1 Tax=Flavobacterium sp. PL11 TaxID=3071717 RepID=UPI002E0CE827|nr:hypothetical protein [Flavobacterium sp. PL11]
MFLNHLKELMLKKTLKKSVNNLDTNFPDGTIQRVGLLIDISSFLEVEKVIKELISNGVLADNITTLAYLDKEKSDQKRNFTVITGSQLYWNGEMKSQEMKNFANQKFDLLLSYYNVEKAILLKITHDSKANFKVGFATIDKRFNHFMIKTKIENHTIFINELFKYLKLLNKL